jgi:hypothetical protein
MRKCVNISPYIRRPLVIYDFATAPFRVSLYMRKILFSFLSVHLIINLFPWHYIFKEPPSKTHKGRDREKIKLNKDGEKVKNWAVSIRILWNGISSGLNLKLDFAPGGDGRGLWTIPPHCKLA